MRSRILALLCWLVLHGEGVWHRQTVFIQKALVWKRSVWLHKSARLVCWILGCTATTIVTKTILVFIQDEDGVVSAHNNEGNLRCSLAFVTSLYRFLFWAPSKAYTSNIAVVTCVITLFCWHEVFKATGFNTFAFQSHSVNSGNERCFCAL